MKYRTLLPLGTIPTGPHEGKVVVAKIIVYSVKDEEYSYTSKDALQSYLRYKERSPEK